MNYIVGDIHGEVTKLRKLVQHIEDTDEEAAYVFLGDYLDKGEDALETLKFLTDLDRKRDCVFLLGNHEYLWLNHDDNNEKSRNYLLKYGGKETMRSLNVNSLQEAKDKLLSNFTFFLLNCSHTGSTKNT